MLVNPPLERPSVSRLGFAAGFLLFDPAPCVHRRACHDLRVDISGWRVTGTGRMLMRAHDSCVHSHRPRRALARIGIPTQLVEDPGPRAVS